MGNSDLTCEDLTRWQNISHEWLLSDAQPLKPPLFRKLPILLLLTQLNFLKFIHPGEELEGTRPPGGRGCRLFDGHDTGPDTEAGDIFVFSLSANGAFLHQSTV